MQDVLLYIQIGNLSDKSCLAFFEKKGYKSAELDFLNIAFYEAQLHLYYT